ncbi:MAG: hypothetical protein OEW89_06335 [Gammaproteobacteria bacterium]|nr:hypothetical protein [Gammaproteobacteria bacterium]MDH5594007.1 hypothetical protein [Gammaproteobacteria bacterium]MDH5614060.1 hypothetical protein [Gammaproteobacteria bacterium]
MPTIIKNNPQHIRKFMWLNIGIGVTLFVVMFLLIMTGQYENLTARIETEMLLNSVAIGGLLYSAFFFILDLFAAPHLQTEK